MNGLQQRDTPGAAAIAYHDDKGLVEALRAGDEAAFCSLLSQYYTAMISLAMLYVSNRAVAEEVVQETWLGVLQGIDRFEGRSSLKTWIFRILSNRARTRGAREGRYVPFSVFCHTHDDLLDQAVVPQRSSSAEPTAWFSGWSSVGQGQAVPEEHFLSQETVGCVRDAIAALPAQQRTVITLRDIEGRTSEETRALLGISETNQRVLLHRARAKVRQALLRANISFEC